MVHAFDFLAFDHYMSEAGKILSNKSGNVKTDLLRGKHDIELQLAKHEKFIKASEFVLSLSALSAVINRHSNKNICLSSLMAHTYKNAITSTSALYAVDYPKVLVTHGNLPRGELAHTKASMGNILFSWAGNSKFRKVRKNDKAILVAYSEALNKCIFTIGIARRWEEEATLEVPQFHEHEVHTWLSFISPDEKSIANSTYAGAVTLSDLH
jgi:hypothetical protein